MRPYGAPAPARSGPPTTPRAVVTQNYDGLLEIALGGAAQPVWRPCELEEEKLPVYHVHGYVPPEGEGSAEHEIVFTEEQYHLAARDAYSWANVVQIQRMSGSVGLMVGLSLSDRNMRRLLDAVKRTPGGSENYALLKKPSWEKPDAASLESIRWKADEYLLDFERSGGGIKAEGTANEQICGILEEVERLDVEQQTFVLEELGVHPIWYKEHTEVPELIAKISTKSKEQPVAPFRR